MTLARLFVPCAIGLSILLLTNFAAPAQSRKPKSRAAKPSVVVREINATSLTSLAARVGSATAAGQLLGHLV